MLMLINDNIYNYQYVYIIQMYKYKLIFSSNNIKLSQITEYLLKQINRL